MKSPKRNTLLFTFAMGLWFGIWGTLFVTAPTITSIQSTVSFTFLSIGICAILLILVSPRH